MSAAEAELRKVEGAARETLASTEWLLRYFGVDPASLDANHAHAWSKHTLALANMRSTLRAALADGKGET